MPTSLINALGQAGVVADFILSISFETFHFHITARALDLAI